MNKNIQYINESHKERCAFITKKELQKYSRKVSWRETSEVAWKALRGKREMRGCHTTKSQLHGKVGKQVFIA